MKLIHSNRTPVNKDWLTEDFIYQLNLLVAPVGLENWKAGLVIVDNQTMMGINHQFRGKNYVTDVISFSHLYFETSQPAAIKSGQCYAYTDLCIEPYEEEIGEIIIAPDFIKERSLELGVDFEDEIAMLVVHGALHLMGWDHKDKKQAVMMKNHESDLLRLIGKTHPIGFREEGI